MLKRLILSSIIATVGLSCSGCATILGGIIGYQSGELAAGMAIGAAVDFGDDIARGIGQIGAKEDDLRRDFNEKSTFDMNKGEITLPICPFNQERVSAIMSRLQRQFAENGWRCEPTQKTVHQRLIAPDRWEEKWTCTTAEQRSFEFHLNFCSDRDTKLKIKQIGCCEKKPRPCGQVEPESEPQPVSEAALTQEEIATITRQIYQWIEQSVTGGTSL